MGFLKAFGLADLPQLAQPIGRGTGMVRLASGIVTIAAALLPATGQRWWWVVGGVAVVLSQAVIITSWSDAKFGTIANVIVTDAVYPRVGADLDDMPIRNLCFDGTKKNVDRELGILVELANAYQLRKRG
jgi:hypothetical protein